MVRREFLTLTAFALGAALGLGAGYGRWHRIAPAAVAAAVLDQRRALAIDRAKDMPPGGLLVLGDSIVERQRLDSLCNLPVLNAGVGSARLGDIFPILPAVLATRPSRVVVAIGANDYHLRPTTRVADFAGRLDDLLSRLPPRPILVGVTDAPALDAAIHAAAARHGGTYVEPIPPALTEDGLHLNPAGLREWKRRVAAAC